jgi:hypothetical protein
LGGRVNRDQMKAELRNLPYAEICRRYNIPK